MTKAQLTALDQYGCKIYLYLVLLKIQNKMFNLQSLREILNFDTEKILKSIKVLIDLNIIDVSFDENQTRIYFLIEQTSIDINIECWNIKSIILFDKIILENHKDTMEFVVNLIYGPLGIFDNETMNKFLNSNLSVELDHSVEVHNRVQIVKKIEKRVRSDDRKVIKTKVQRLVDFFYQELDKKISLVITEKLTKNELMNAKEFFSRYPEYPEEMIFEGIIWFINHKFWHKVVTDIQKLTKHFNTFLIEAKGIKNKTHKIILK